MVTGCPPCETGIGGNYIIDPDTGEEVMTNSPSFLRLETILASAAQAGRKVAMVTAKDKLRKLLSKNLQGIAFSTERADEVTQEEHGIADIVSHVGPKPKIYSAEASLYVLRSGVHLIESGAADFCYLTLTDYMQHKFAPEEPESLDFLRIHRCRTRATSEARLSHRRDRRSRDECQVQCGGHSQRRLSGVRVDASVWRRHQGHLPDHRSLCSPPWGFGFRRHGVSAV